MWNERERLLSCTQPSSAAMVAAAAVPAISRRGTDSRGPDVCVQIRFPFPSLPPFFCGRAFLSSRRLSLGSLPAPPSSLALHPPAAMSIDYAVRFSHWLFQLANCFLFLSYVSPSILALRIFIASAGLCFLVRAHTRKAMQASKAKQSSNERTIEPQ